jgi:hypothetical protein
MCIILASAVYSDTLKILLNSFRPLKMKTLSSFVTSGKTNSAIRHISVEWNLKRTAVENSNLAQSQRWHVEILKLRPIRGQKCFLTTEILFWLLPILLKVRKRCVEIIRKGWTVLKIIVVFDVTRHSSKVMSREKWTHYSASYYTGLIYTPANTRHYNLRH